VSRHCINLLNAMLAYHPDKRLSAAQALRRRFIRKSYEGEEVNNADLRISVLNLRNFNIQTKFQKAVLTYCASQQLSQKAEAKIRKLFESLDTNGDGKLTKEDLTEGYTKLFGDVKKAKKEAEYVLRNISYNHSGVIEYNGMILILYIDNFSYRISYSKYENKNSSKRRESKSSI